MADFEQVERLRSDVETWNQWRKDHPNVHPDLSDVHLITADLREANLGNANLNGANLSGANLSRADLGKASLILADLSGADLSRADLSGADLNQADLRGAALFSADLQEANLSEAQLRGVDLSRANLRELDLEWADLSGVDLSGARLSRAKLHGAKLNGAKLLEADLREADLREADLSKAVLVEAKLIEARLGAARLISARLNQADLSRADLSQAILVDADLQEANLSQANLLGADVSRVDLTQAQLVGTILRNATLAGCRIYGVSTWDLQLEGAIQTNLLITPRNEPEITVDDLEVAQFLYLMLHNEKIRKVIDTLVSKVVLILGRFTESRKQVLEALREKLRQHDYVPVLFDFDESPTMNTTQTVTLLAKMARFVIADLTSPASVPWELAKIVPDANVPVQTLLLEGATTFYMAKDLWQLYPNLMLPLYRYTSIQELLDTLSEQVIAPAEARVADLQRLRIIPLSGEL